MVSGMAPDPRACAHKLPPTSRLCVRCNRSTTRTRTKRCTVLENRSLTCSWRDLLAHETGLSGWREPLSKICEAHGKRALATRSGAALETFVPPCGHEAMGTHSTSGTNVPRLSRAPTQLRKREHECGCCIRKSKVSSTSPICAVRRAEPLASCPTSGEPPKSPRPRP